MSDALIVFGKPARPGKVKTRLCPPLSFEQAAELYGGFARDVLEMATRFARDAEDDLRLVLAWDGDEDDELAQFAQDRGFSVVSQGEGDLGSRLRRVVRSVRRRRARRIVVIGTDAPTLSEEHLNTARLLLGESDVVFGPAFDGGYYLVALGEPRIGVPAPEDVVFDGISWSSSAVLEESWKVATGSGLLCDLLGFWYDVDTYEDLKKLRFHLLEYLTERDPEVGQFTRPILESHLRMRDDDS